VKNKLSFLAEFWEFLSKSPSRQPAASTTDTMAVLNLGYTGQVNKPGTSPTLTAAQVWAGLERKVRHAEEFVPVIEGCTVLSEEKKSTGETVVTRDVQFVPGSGPKEDGSPVKEVCELFAPCRVDFYQENGTKISNFATAGPSGDAHDLFLTYVFEWRHPGVEQGGEKAKALEANHKKVSMGFGDAQV
jgi:hypothetical protein